MEYYDIAVMALWFAIGFYTHEWAEKWDRKRNPW